MGIEELLKSARAAIARDDLPAALGSLLEAWRARRAPRLADVIDRVSRRLGHAPFEPTSLPDKLADARPLVEALVDRAADPRVAVALAHIAEAISPSRFYEVASFYETLLRGIAKMDDPRTKPILAQRLARPAVFQWCEGHRAPLVRTLAHLCDAPSLDAREETALVGLESLFANDISAAAADESKRAEFLAAIYSNPADDVTRAVYADLLVEWGDPRGEFITLQLMRNPSKASRVRIKTLLAQHGRAWAGELDQIVDRRGRVFTRGFLSRVFIDYYISEATAATTFAYPEWALVESIAFPWREAGCAAAVFATPWGANVRELSGLRELDFAFDFAELDARHLEQVHIFVNSEPMPEMTEARTRLASTFPHLKNLGLSGTSEALAQFLTSPLPPKLERLTVVAAFNPSLLADTASLVEKRHSGLSVLCLKDEYYANEDQLSFELRRDATGHFTRLRCGPEDPNDGIRASWRLAAVLASLPRITELVIDEGTSLEFDEGGVEQVAARIAKLDALRWLETPWCRGGDRATRLDVRFTGPERLGDSIDAIWEIATAPPVSFRPVSGIPLDERLRQLKKGLGKSPGRGVTIHGKDDGLFVLYRGTLRLAMQCGADFDLEAWLAWLCATIERLPVEEVDAPFHSAGPASWITSLRPHDASELPLAALPTVRVVCTSRLNLVIFGDSPAAAPPNEARATLDAIVQNHRRVRP